MADSIWVKARSIQDLRNWIIMEGQFSPCATELLECLMHIDELMASQPSASGCVQTTLDTAEAFPPSDQEIEEWADQSDLIPLEELVADKQWQRCFLPEEFYATIRSALARWGSPAARAALSAQPPAPAAVTDPIRAALERLVELDASSCMQDAKWASKYENAIADAIEALAAQPPAPAPASDGEREELAQWIDSIMTPSFADPDGVIYRRFARAATLIRQPAPAPAAVPAEQWHEDMGPVFWWRFPVEEPPYCGSPLDTDWPGYHTHFTPPAIPPAAPGRGGAAVTTKDCKSNPSTEYRFFLYCPNDGLTFWRTEEDRDKAGRDLIEEYLSDGEWNDQIDLISAGTVTHHVVEVDRKERVGELDDDGYDEAGEYWASNEYDYACNHELRPLDGGEVEA